MLLKIIFLVLDTGWIRFCFALVFVSAKLFQLSALSLNSKSAEWFILNVLTADWSPNKILNDPNIGRKKAELRH